jgi:hypothetical protein
MLNDEKPKTKPNGGYVCAYSQCGAVLVPLQLFWTHYSEPSDRNVQEGRYTTHSCFKLKRQSRGWGGVEGPTFPRLAGAHVLGAAGEPPPIGHRARCWPGIRPTEDGFFASSSDRMS